MAKSSIDALRKQREALQLAVAQKNSEAVKSRKTAKGQRAAKDNKQTEFVSARSVHNNGCVDGIIVGEYKHYDATTGETVLFEDWSLGLCPMCFPPMVEKDIKAWTTPVEATTWLKHLYAGKPVSVKAMNKVDAASHDEAIDAGKALMAYQRYVHNVFAQPVTFTESGSFEKIVNRQIARERAGFANLGLLGYSAADIADLAVFYAWVKRVARFAEQVGATPEEASLLSRALRDRRSNQELLADAELGTHKRIVFGNDGRLRHQDITEKVALARKYLIARRLFKASNLSTYSSDFLPTAGDVYREVKAVIYEGLRQFNNALEGLTYEGVVTDAIFFNGRESVSLSSVEAELFDEHVFDEVALRRTATIELLEEMAAELTPAEVDAFIFAKALADGTKLADIQSIFECTDRKFNQIARDAETIMVLVPGKKIDKRVNKLMNASRK